jgi:4-diphosphocytidyl-2-C-methyl-D-erythritol kinase
MYLRSYGKINLVLEVLSKREDNYHNISSIFSLVNIYDDVYINLKRNSKWELVLDVNNVELMKSNILFRLIDELNKYRELEGFLVEVKLLKKIPIGGGLGGGSANAATILFYLFIKNIINLKIAKELALKLGADVFPIFILYLFKFLYKKNILVLNLGRQDIVVPLVNNYINPYHILFIFPNISVSTKRAFELLNKDQKKLNLIGPKTKDFLIYFREKKILDYNFFYNEFEKVVLLKYSNIDLVKNIVEEILRDIEIKEYRFLLSGSGSTLLFFIPKKYSKNKIINDFNKRYIKLSQKELFSLKEGFIFGEIF